MVRQASFFAAFLPEGTSVGPDGQVGTFYFPNVDTNSAPTLTAGNAAYKLLNKLGDAEVIGPILSGLNRSVHVLQRDAEVGDVVNLTAIAVNDAQRKGSGVEQTD